MSSHETFEGLCIIKMLNLILYGVTLIWWGISMPYRTSWHHGGISFLNKALEKRFLKFILSCHFHLCQFSFSLLLLKLPFEIFSLLFFRCQFTGGSSLLIEVTYCFDKVVKLFFALMSVFRASWSRWLGSIWLWWKLRQVLWMRVRIFCHLNDLIKILIFNISHEFIEIVPGVEFDELFEKVVLRIIKIRKSLAICHNFLN